MGTRSVTIIQEQDGKEICRIYRQYDGYPRGAGKELAMFCNRIIINGIRLDAEGPGNYGERFSNGMGELAAQLVAKWKNEHPVGNIYLQPPTGEFSEYVDYTYVIRCKTGEQPTLECFGLDDDPPYAMGKHIFGGTSKEWIEWLNKPEDKVTVDDIHAAIVK